jgi:hypothetical protein
MTSAMTVAAPLPRGRAPGVATGVRGTLGRGVVRLPPRPESAGRRLLSDDPLRPPRPDRFLVLGDPLLAERRLLGRLPLGLLRPRPRRLELGLLLLVLLPQPLPFTTGDRRGEWTRLSGRPSQGGPSCAAYPPGATTHCLAQFPPPVDESLWSRARVFLRELVPSVSAVGGWLPPTPSTAA